MPEAPEVAQVLDYLRQQLTGAKITGCTITHPKLSANMDAESFCTQITGEHFRNFHRKGKYLVFELDDKDVVAHLRMEGKFLVLKNQEELEALDPIKERKHIHAIFTLDDGRKLCYKDTRKFGRMYLYEKPEHWQDLPALQNTGKDALDPSLSAEELYEKTKKRKLAVKSILLDQSVIAGIGNIYADEILYAAHIHPRTPANHLDLSDWEKILCETRRILSASLEAGGTTIRSFSFGNHQEGSYQNALKIHGQKGVCPHCGHEVVMERINGRSSWYCPQCQKEK